MSYYHTLEYYQEQIAQAEKKYIEIMKGDNAASVLMKWFVENDITEIFYPLSWTEKTNTLEGFVELYQQLWWCLYDDGSLIFMDTDRGPIIYFGCRLNYPEQLPKELQNLSINKRLNVRGLVNSSLEYVWGFMKAWEERHAYWIEDRNRFKQWIPWTTYQKNFTGDEY